MTNRIREPGQRASPANFLLNRLELLIDTVQKFQGDERDAMIFSPVVSEGITDGAVSFLKKTDNLFNVAITRARAALIVVGDPTAAKSAGVTYLAAFTALLSLCLPQYPDNLFLAESTLLHLLLLFEQYSSYVTSTFLGSGHLLRSTFRGGATWDRAHTSDGQRARVPSAALPVSLR